MIRLQPQKLWRLPTVAFPATRYLFDLLFEHTLRCEGTKVATLFYRFQCCPETKISAGWLLDKALHKLLIRGRHWTVRPLASIPDRSWTTNPRATPEYLALSNQGIGCLRRRKWEDHEVNEVPEYVYTLPLPLQPGYYAVDHLERRPSINSFLYDPLSQRAIIFRVTVDAHRALEPAGLQWLLEQGLRIQEVWYVFVTPAQSIEVSCTMGIQPIADPGRGRRFREGGCAPLTRACHSYTSGRIHFTDFHERCVTSRANGH